MARKEEKKKHVWLRAILITLGVLIVACSGVLLKAYLDVKDMTDAVYVPVSKENMRAEDGGSDSTDLIEIGRASCRERV